MSERSRKGPALLAGALGTGVLALALLLFGRAVERGSFAEAYSTFRAAPNGAKAAYLILKRLGYPVSRHAEEVMALEGVDLLFVIEPDDAAGRGALFSEDETRSLEGFVKEGGTLVVAATVETAVHKAFGVRLVEGEVSGDGVVPALPSPCSRGVSRLEPDPHPRSLAASSAAAVPIFRREGKAERVEALALSSGKGKAIFFADPSLFSNRAIGRADNGALVAAIAAARAGSGIVAFDEYHHGFTAERGVAGYLGRRSLQPALLEAGAAFLALALALGGRRGRPPILEEERPPESREHIRAMAEIYAKAGLRAYCVDRLHRAIIRDVEVALGGVPPAAEGKSDPVAEALERRGVHGFRGLEKIARRRARLWKSKGGIPEHELLLFAREVARFELDCRRALGQRFGEI